MDLQLTLLVLHCVGSLFTPVMDALPLPVSTGMGSTGSQSDSPGIVAFDCNNTHLDVLTYDLTRVDECEPVHNISTDEQSVKVQIVQTRERDVLQVHRCHVVSHILMWHCGMHSHTSIANYDIAPQPIELTKHQCVTLHQDGRVTFAGHEFGNIRPNRTTIVHQMEVGNVWGEGFCEGGTITMGGYKYTNVVVKRSYTIQLQDKVQYYKIGTEEIMGYNGLVCRLSDTTCYDYEVGRVFWTPSRLACHENQYESLYVGPAVLISTNRLGPHSTYVRIHPSSLSKFQLFTPLVSRAPICSFDGWVTPYAGLYIIEYAEKAPLPMNNPLPANVDIIRYIETKFMSFAYGSTLSTMDIVLQLAMSQCKSLRETLLNRLHIIAANPTSANLIVGNKPGVFGRVAGEVIHILQCPPVEVMLRSSQQCTMEIPITYNAANMYMDSRTRIITDTPTYQDCSTLTPVMFRHGTKWVQMTPTFSPADNPKVLKPQQDKDFSFNRITSYAQGGIYDPKDLQQVREFMMFSNRREAMTSNMLSGLEGKSQIRYDLTQVLHEDGWKALAKDRLKQMWGSMQVVGEWVSGFLGIYFCLIIIKSVIGITIRTFNIYKLTGMSWTLIAGIWSVFTQYVLSTVRPPQPKRSGDTAVQQESIELLPTTNSCALETTTVSATAPKLYPDASI